MGMVGGPHIGDTWFLLGRITGNDTSTAVHRIALYMVLANFLGFIPSVVGLFKLEKIVKERVWPSFTDYSAMKR